MNFQEFDFDEFKGCVLFIANHPNGFGQLHRALKNAAAVQQMGRPVIVVTSDVEEKYEIHDGVPVLTLTPPYSIKGEYDPDSLEYGDIENFGEMAPELTRRQKLLRFFEESHPSAVVVEGFPFLQDKMHLTVEALRNACDRLDWSMPFLASIRDIVGHEKAEWSKEAGPLLPTISATHPRYGKKMEGLSNFDGLLIHGDERIAPFDFDLSGVEIPVHYTGYVVGDMPPRTKDMNDQDRPILVSVGGGSYGSDFLYLAFEAMCCTTLKNPWHFITGKKNTSGIAEAFAEFAAFHGFIVEYRDEGKGKAHTDILVSRHRTDFTKLLADCLVSIGNVGYNTVTEGLKVGARLITAPAYKVENKVTILHREQTLRAEIMSRQGMLRSIYPNKIKPQQLARVIEEAAVAPVTTNTIDMNGGRRSAEIIEDYIATWNAKIPGPASRSRAFELRHAAGD